MDTHGSARFATRRDLESHDRLPPWEPGSVPDGLLSGWWFESEYDFQPITYRGDLHQLIVGGIGGGKFTTALAPMLIGSGLEDQTVVAIDPKGRSRTSQASFSSARSPNSRPCISSTRGTNARRDRPPRSPSWTS